MQSEIRTYRDNLAYLIGLGRDALRLGDDAASRGDVDLAAICENDLRLYTRVVVAMGFDPAEYFAQVQEGPR